MNGANVNRQKDLGSENMGVPIPIVCSGHDFQYSGYIRMLRMTSLHNVKVIFTLNLFEGVSHFPIMVLVPYNPRYTRASLASAVVSKENGQQIIKGTLSDKEKMPILARLMELRDKLNLRPPW